MGLDMYLYLDHYVKNWDHHAPEALWSFEITRGGDAITDEEWTRRFEERHPGRAPVPPRPTSREIDTSKITTIREQVAYWRKVNCVHAWFVTNCQGGVDDCRPAYVSREQLVAVKQLDAVLERDLDWPTFVYQSSW